MLSGSVAFAAPRRPAAKKQFKRGVAAYTKGDYAAASAALARSFKLEADAETLFAWAQTERKLEHCDRAIELYSKLLRMDLPAANKKAVSVQIDECKEILAAQQPAPEHDPQREADRPNEREGRSDRPNEREGRSERDGIGEPDSSASGSASSSELGSVSAGEVHTSNEGHAWWKDPVGGALVGVGLVGVGVGAVFLVQAHAAEADKASAGSYEDFHALDEKAHSRGQLGVVGLAAGGAFIAVGALWYATRKPSSSPTVTGWLAPTGGGLAVAGGF
jgi:hypothetical protein